MDSNLVTLLLFNINKGKLRRKWKYELEQKLNIRTLITILSKRRLLLLAKICNFSAASVTFSSDGVH